MPGDYQDLCLIRARRGSVWVRRPGEGGSTAHFSSETLVVLSSYVALRRKLAYTRESNSYNLARTRLAAGFQRSRQQSSQQSSQIRLRYLHCYQHSNAPTTRLSPDSWNTKRRRRTGLEQTTALSVYLALPQD